MVVAAVVVVAVVEWIEHGYGYGDDGGGGD
jgi:hypothetical protein